MYVINAFLQSTPIAYLNAPERNIFQNQSIISDSLLVEGQYKSWTLDWTMD